MAPTVCPSSKLHIVESGSLTPFHCAAAKQAHRAMHLISMLPEADRPTARSMYLLSCSALCRLRQEGDMIKKGEPVVVVESDKVHGCNTSGTRPGQTCVPLNSQQ